MILYKILFIIDIIIALVFIFFFFIGIADGTVSEKNMALWLMILGALGSIIYGSYWFSSQHRFAAASGLASVIAIPALLAAIFLLILIVTKARWN